MKMKQNSGILNQYDRFFSINKGSSGTRFFYIILFSLLVFLTITGCGPRIQGYGVVLWADKDTGLVNGEIVKILSESIIRNAYIVFKEKPEEEVPIHKWRLEVFKTQKQAGLYAEEYAPYSPMYAYPVKDGVPPVRETPDSSGGVKIISKPKAYQPLKVLGRTEEKTEINEMIDYWYHVLVEYQGIGTDGQYQLLGGKGYCFGYSLEIFETDEDPEEEIAKRIESESTEDPLVNLLQNVWRPDYFSEMMRSGKLDPDLFKSTVGLFPEPEAQRIIISTVENYYQFDYTEITEVRKNLYSFQGADLRIEIYSKSRISVTYMADTEQVNVLYRKINTDIDSLIEREIQIRNALYEDFFLRGPILSSSAYGTIVLHEDKTITWTGFEKLIPSVIPHEITGKGGIDFPHYITSALKDKYDGVMTFYFKGYSPDIGVNFLYKKTEKGVRLFYVKKECINERKVIKTDLNPIVIFFTFSGG